MGFRILSFFGKKSEEQEVVDLFAKHLAIVKQAKDLLQEVAELAFAKEFDLVKKKSAEVSELERQADALKIEINYKLQKGAFLPSMRTNLYNLITANDQVCNEVKNASNMFIYLKALKVPKEVIPIIRNIIKKAGESVDALQKNFISLSESKQDMERHMSEVRNSESGSDRLQRDVFDTFFFKLKGKKDALTIQTVGKLAHYISSIADEAEDASQVMMLIRIMKQS